MMEQKGFITTAVIKPDLDATEVDAAGLVQVKQGPLESGLDEGEPEGAEQVKAIDEAADEEDDDNEGITEYQRLLVKLAGKDTEEDDAENEDNNEDWVSAEESTKEVLADKALPKRVTSGRSTLGQGYSVRNHTSQVNKNKQQHSASNRTRRRGCTASIVQKVCSKGRSRAVCQHNGSYIRRAWHRSHRPRQR